MPAADRTLQRMLRRLQAAELLHLREHCAELAQQLEDLQREAAAANDSADYWREQCLRVQEDLAENQHLGMTADGTLGIV
ncbi:MAG: hypothetical protein MUF08_16980, partial [Burkholderiaceae bacterium]|nr:hypothetical protein [Burkholderiaceae bacterium]